MQNLEFGGESAGTDTDEDVVITGNQEEGGATSSQHTQNTASHIAIHISFLMGDYSREDEGCPQLLDLIPKWATKRGDERSHGISVERKLELRLGPPGGEWTIKESSTATCGERERDRLLSLGYFPASPCPQNTVLKPPSPWQQHHLHPSYLHLQHGQGQVAVSKESPQSCSNRAAAEQTAAEKKAFSAANTAVHKTAQKRCPFPFCLFLLFFFAFCERVYSLPFSFICPCIYLFMFILTAPASVVGWPPIRSFRKNIASKPASDSPDVAPSKVSNSVENGSRTPFVKINMDGIPIGRKIDLKAYHSYEKLSYAVDELFRGLLAAQKKSCGGGITDEGEGGEMIGGLLDGSGEYTLLYEDHEGDRMLVGDVPWHMFISAVKRLRVLKSSELPTLSREFPSISVSIDIKLLSCPDKK
ncbi:hypothetical protein SASPL_139499 [Salvia splendens]|uniref:Auxin-responsive protein n=1 Tax=Salvia splendens TaxID=180675 RepID=A0A8X8WQ73_SALSN|nr:hypothetical protein SASPL_139499 [Salvia splendens]